MSSKSTKKLPPPRPMAAKGKPVDWMFAFKFNSESFPGKKPNVGSPGIFGGTYKCYPRGHSRQYVFATSANPKLVRGAGGLGG